MRYTPKSIKLASMDAKQVAREIQEQIVQKTLEARATGGVIGLSGGIDSTTVAYLAHRGYEQHNKEHPDNPLRLYGMIMPSKSNASEDELDGNRVADDLGIEKKTVYIQPMLEVLKEADPEVFEEAYHQGNAGARARMLLLYGNACKKNLLVLGTGNLDEDQHIGYFTKYGDGGVDYSPIGELPKRLVRELAASLGVPDDLVNRTPTAGLWAGQTDENELGYSYDEVEIVMSGHEQGYTVEEIVEDTTISREVVEDVLHRHKVNKHKMEMPEIAKVTLEHKVLEVEA